MDAVTPDIVSRPLAAFVLGSVLEQSTANLSVMRLRQAYPRKDKYDFTYQNTAEKLFKPRPSREVTR
jgi:hypothetical protein